MRMRECRLFLAFVCALISYAGTAQAQECDPAQSWQVVAGFAPGPADQQAGAWWEVDYAELAQTSSNEATPVIRQVAEKYPEHAGKAVRKFLVGRNLCSGQIGVEIEERKETPTPSKQVIEEKLATEVASVLPEIITREIRKQGPPVVQKPTVVTAAPPPDRRRNFLVSAVGCGGGAAITLLTGGIIPLIGGCMPATANLVSWIIPDSKSREKHEFVRSRISYDSPEAKREAFLQTRMKKWM